MNTLNTQEQIKVMQAYVDGKAIEVQKGVCTEWLDAPQPSWDWWEQTYRIKPEPLELWVNVYPSGTVKAHKLECEAKQYRGTVARTVKMREVL